MYVPLPDRATRLKILKVHTKKKPVHDEVALSDIADETEGYSGAELSAVCNEAALKALQEAILASESEPSCEAGQTPKIKSEHFQSALKSVTPRINQDLLDIYEKFQTKEKR